MKRLNTKTILAIVIALSSVLSYLYLSSLDVAANEKTETSLKDKSVNEEDPLQDAQTHKLPDLQLLIKVVELGRKFLPAS